MPQPINGIAANMFHGEGAIAQCGRCRRYTLDRAALSDRQPVCTCGERYYWSGSFLPPGLNAQWYGPAPEAQAAPAAVAEPSTPFTDPRVQIVYALLADSEAMPPDGQHWEGWVARRIVDALAAAPAAAQPVAGEPVARVVRDAAAVRLEWAGVREAHNAKPGPLYTTPPALVGLSDEQIDQIGNGLNGIDPPISRRERDRRIARAALAAANGMTLREGGNG